MTARRKLFHSYTSRLAVLYAFIFSVSTLLLFYFFYLFTAPYMAQQVDNTIQAEIQGLAERYDNEGLGGLTALIADRVDRQKARGTGNSIYLLTTYTFKPLVGNLDRWPKNATVADDWIEFDLVINQETNQTHLARAKIFRLPGRYGLLVGRDINQLIEVKRRITQALIWGFAIMLLLAVIGGLILSRRTVRKIERINQTTRNIMSGDLSRRVPLTGHNDDFDQVAANLNQMLDRIQSLMEDIRRVSDSIAHDLRTPLTRLRQHLEAARRRETPDSESTRLLEGAIKEADSLLSTFSSLLRIARIESGQIKFGFSQIDFHALVGDIIEFYEPLAEARQQRLETEIQSGIEFFGDRDLLFQAVANLIENAIKYTPRRGRIGVALARRGDHAIITVADNGPGIPANERDNVFRRFYRLDQSRSSSGNGLGLSMVSAVVAMHNGSIELQDNHPGLRTVMKLPLATQSEESASASSQNPSTAPPQNEPTPSVGQAA
ncbi:MAG: ATP-binding protein [bacterium]